MTVYSYTRPYKTDTLFYLTRGAATECENPFSAKRTNHLGMDGFCENIIGDTSAMLEWWREEVVSGVGWGGRESVRGTNGE